MYVLPHIRILQCSTFWFAPLHGFLPKVCRITSTAAPEVMSFKADEHLKPGEVEWANYIRVRPWRSWRTMPGVRTAES